MGFYDKVKTDKGVINVLNASVGNSRMNYQANDYVRIIGLGTQPNIANVAEKYSQYRILGYETDLFSLLDDSKITSTNWVTLLTFESGAIVRGKKNDRGDIVEIFADNKTVINLYYSSTTRFSAYKNAGYKCFIVYYGTTTEFINPDIIATGASPNSPKQIITWENLPKDYQPVLVYYVVTNKGEGEYIDNTSITWSDANTQNFIWDYKSRGYNSSLQTSYSSWDLLRRTFYGKVNPSFEDFNSTTGGGDGDYLDDSSDTIGLPDLTALNQNSISNTKFLTCYKMTPAQLNKLGDELWSDNIFTQISNTVLKPTDFIVNLSLLPVDVGGVTKLIKAGKILLNGAEGTLISQQFIRVDCGSLEVKKKWGGAIDYQTDVSIFLPFIGEQSLNANEVMGATLNVIYTVDILSGSCIASVRVIKDSLDAVLYQFSGNMSSNFPITSADYATVFSGALQLAVGVGSLPSSGGVLSLVSATSNMLSGANVKRTGSLSSSAGFMGIKKPYIILSRPIQSLPENYNSFHGYVSNITMKLKDCEGYTQVDSIHIDNVPCMEEEKTRLLQILKEGIII